MPDNNLKSVVIKSDDGDTYKFALRRYLGKHIATVNLQLLRRTELQITPQSAPVLVNAAIAHLRIVLTLEACCALLETPDGNLPPVEENFEELPPAVLDQAWFALAGTGAQRVTEPPVTPETADPEKVDDSGN